MTTRPHNSTAKRKPAALAVSLPTAGLPKEFEALSERQTKFVLALFSLSNPSYGEAAAAAGYKSDRPESLRQMGWRLAHDLRVRAAIHAECLRRCEIHAPTALQNVKDIAGGADVREKLKANRLLLSLAGLRDVQEVRVEHVAMSKVEEMRELRRLAAALGIDEHEALGNLTDAEVVELQKGEDGTYSEGR